MAEVTVQRTINAPVEDVWASWDAYGDIVKFNPGIARSFLLDGSSSTGLGAERQCDFPDNKNYVRERVIGYVPEKQMVIDIFDSTVPIKKAVATITFVPVGQSSTSVTMRMEFTPKLGLIGMMMSPLM